MLDAEQRRHVVDAHRPLRLGVKPAPEQQIMPHRQMREEAPFLEDIADTALVLRHEDATRGIDEVGPVDGDPAREGPGEAGDDVDERGLAGAGAAEERGEAGAALECDIEREAAEAMLDVDLEHQPPESLRPIRRARSSAATSAAIDTAIEMRVRRIAAASPPGTCVKV